MGLLMIAEMWPLYLMLFIIIAIFMAWLVGEADRLRIGEAYKPPEEYEIKKVIHECRMEHFYVITYKGKYLRIKDSRDFLVNFTSLHFEHLDKAPLVSGFGLYTGGTGWGMWFDTKATCQSVIEKHKKWLEFRNQKLT